MHSNKKNPKYETNSGNDSDDDRYPHIPRKSKKKQLSVEVEMNESVENLLSSPDNCDSALLDITIINPSEMAEQSAAKTNTMRSTQVKKLLANLNREKHDKKLLYELFEDKAPSEDTIVRISKHNPRNKIKATSDLCYDNFRQRKYLKSQFHRRNKSRNNKSSSAPVDAGRKHLYSHCYSPGIIQVSPAIGRPPKFDDQSEDSYSDDLVPDTHTFKCGDHKKTHHVYAATRTFKDLNSIITCQSMSKDDRTPCLCEHCGIASLLSETQKRPIITAPVEHVSDLRRKMNRKDYRDSSKHETRKRKPDHPYVGEEKGSYQAGLSNLFERLKMLEDRMDVQEERAVPKDYFKRIITKLIAHFSPKVPYRNENFQLRDSDSSSYVMEPRYKNNYSVNTLLVDKKSQKMSPSKCENRENLKRILNNLTENMPENKREEFCEHFWRWGSEILKPGVDLKNKIISLLDMTNQGIKEKSERRPKTQPRETNHTKISSSNRSLPENKNFDSEAFKNFVEAMSAKILKSRKRETEGHASKCPIDAIASSCRTCSDTSLYKKPNIENAESKFTKKSSKSTKKEMKSFKSGGETTKNVNISYLNPKLSTWQEEESQISFKLEFSDADTNTQSKGSKIRDLEKLEFLRTLSRTKDSDKEKLWESIWAQAKSNGQTKQDKVTIQLPRRNGSEFNDMIEIEFTIGEIEYMLTKHKYVDKNKVKS